jgi:hypothetical protein
VADSALQQIAKNLGLKKALLSNMARIDRRKLSLFDLAFELRF